MLAHFGISKIQILATRQWRVIPTSKSLPACPGMKAYQDDSNNNPRSIKIRQASLFPKQPYIKKTNLFLARGNFVRGQIVNLFMTKTLVGCCWIRLDELIVIYKLQPWFMQWCDHSGFEKKSREKYRRESTYFDVPAAESVWDCSFGRGHLLPRPRWKRPQLKLLPRMMT